MLALSVDRKVSVNFLPLESVVSGLVKVILKKMKEIFLEKSQFVSSSSFYIIILIIFIVYMYIYTHTHILTNCKLSRSH